MTPETRTRGVLAQVDDASASEPGDDTTTQDQEAA